MSTKNMRIEKDCLGEVEVPADAYYGVQSVRAVHNFPISGLKVNPYMIKAAGCIKKAAAMANANKGRLKQEIAEAIVQAAEEVISLKLIDHFVVDAIQSGAGVSCHLNPNEVMEI